MQLQIQLQISVIKLKISLFQLQISVIKIQISVFKCRYLQLCIKCGNGLPYRRDTTVEFCRVGRCELNRRQSAGILNSLNNKTVKSKNSYLSHV